MTLAIYKLNERQYVRTDDLAEFLNIPIAAINAFCMKFLATAENSFKSSVELFPSGAVNVHMLDTTAFFEFYQDYEAGNPGVIAEEDQLAVRYELGEFDARPIGDEGTCIHGSEPLTCEREVCLCVVPGSFKPFEETA